MTATTDDCNRRIILICRHNTSLRNPLLYSKHHIQNHKTIYKISRKLKCSAKFFETDFYPISNFIIVYLSIGTRTKIPLSLLLILEFPSFWIFFRCFFSSSTPRLLLKKLKRTNNDDNIDGNNIENERRTWTSWTVPPNKRQSKPRFMSSISLCVRIYIYVCSAVKN